jgi:hypothetical protein
MQDDDNLVFSPICQKCHHRTVFCGLQGDFLQDIVTSAQSDLAFRPRLFALLTTGIHPRCARREEARKFRAKTVERLRAKTVEKLRAKTVEKPEVKKFAVKPKTKRTVGVATTKPTKYSQSMIDKLIAEAAASALAAGPLQCVWSGIY